MPRWSFRFLAAAAALALGSCNCADPSTIGFTSCTSNDDCPVNGLRACCDGFCREKCEAKNDGGGGSGGGGGGGGTAGGTGGGGGGGAGVGGGTGTCVPACAPGQFCNAQNVCDCNATSCTSGCCSGATCTLRGISNCAPSGAQCAACDPEKADRCSSAGICQCGTVGADGGVATACGAGQRCVLNQCKCDATSCPNGCCNGNQCVTNTTAAACGLPGAACSACDNTKANACSATGACRCGTEPACGAGQACGMNGCECNPTSCTTGCCSGATCVARSAATCGAGGAACVACSPDKADTCTAAGSCSCGVNGLCGTGTRCVNGACVCDGQSCPTGCCQAGVCTTLSPTACAAPGAACLACTAGKADNCSAQGQCRCGTFPACGAAQTCTSGMCTGGSCNSTTCPNGCCDGSQMCQAQTAANCGSGGSACVACDLQKANGCATDGTCRCGPGPACGAQQRCFNNACVCDASTCPNGCCSGNQCITPTATQCGTGGAVCANCGQRSDACVTGACQCGSSQPCAAGQRCVGGACICDGQSGCAGCCSGNTCLAPSAGACGSMGSVCSVCDMNLADGCANGACTCGATAACGPGQKCSGGVCVCTPATCPGGCCNNGSCNTPPTLAKCGLNGATCVACDLNKTDTCSATGVCSCGIGPPCADGTRCVGGSCQCDGLSCAGGCCEAGTICHAPPSGMYCGLNGVACQDCGGGKTCNNGVCIGSGSGGGGGGFAGGIGGSGGSSGVGGGTGGGSGMGGVHHLQIRSPSLTGSTGTCVPFSVEAANALNQGMSSPINLSYVAHQAAHLTTYGNGACSSSPTYFAGLQVQQGGLVSSKFGITNLYPTITSPSGYAQPNMPVPLTTSALLSGFPSTLVYGACTPVTLVAGAPALDDTQLTLNPTGGVFHFTAGGSCGGIVPPVIFQNTNQVVVRTRSYTGGTVNITGFPDALQFTPVTVTLVRPTDGGACAGQGQSCTADSDCCGLLVGNCAGACLQ